MMDRRQFLARTALGSAWALLNGGCQLPPAVGDAGPVDAGPPPVPRFGGDGGDLPVIKGRRYNVLFIAIDDLNDWVGCMGGHPNTSTPNIDTLASRGVLFQQAQCSMALCNPSRTAVLTGLKPTTTGIYSNFDWFRDRRRWRDWVTLPQYFRAHGYRTLSAGKVFHGWSGKMADPASWDTMLLENAGTPWPDLVDRFRHGLKGQFLASSLNQGLDWHALDLEDRATYDWQIADRAANFLATPGQRPFFMACGFFRPHLPWYAPVGYFAQHPRSGLLPPLVYPGDLDDLPQAARIIANRRDFDLLRASGRWMDVVQAYLACISFCDACVGHLLAALEASVYRDDTAVVLFSDNGFHLGEKFHLEKGTLWNEAARVPFIVYAPGVTPAGGRCPSPVVLADIYPTLIELCGLTPRFDLDGRSLAPLLAAPTTAWPWPAITTYYYHCHSVSSLRYRLIHYPAGSEELYDHALDPRELDNRIAAPSYAPVRDALAAWLPRGDALPWT